MPREINVLLKSYQNHSRVKREIQLFYDVFQALVVTYQDLIDIKYDTKKKLD